MPVFGVLFKPRVGMTYPKNLSNLKMVSKRPQWIIRNLQILCASVTIAFLPKNHVNVLGGHNVPPPVVYNNRHHPLGLAGLHKNV